PEYSPSPDYVHGPKYLEYVAPSDDDVPIKDHPLPTDASFTALSLGYIVDSDAKEDLKENPEVCPTDSPADGGDDDDDKEEEEGASKEDEHKEEEHLAPADSATPITSPPGSPWTKLSKIPPLTFMLPSSTHRDDFIEEDMPLQKRARFSALASRFKVRESLAVATARRDGHALNSSVDCRFIDTVDASVHAFESRAMTAIGEVN
nr:hypothetical protein [Tanacetum cinerariifolium]